MQPARRDVLWHWGVEKRPAAPKRLRGVQCEAERVDGLDHPEPRIVATCPEL